MLPDLDSRCRPGATHVDISVVIPAYKGERTIVDCLESIDVATRGRRREVIVVDSSADGTPDIVTQRFPDVKLIQSPQRLSAGGARNVGAAASSGALVFFTDQDCVVPPDWVNRIEAHFRDPEVDGVGGTVGIRNPSSASGCALYFLEFLNHFPSDAPVQRDGKFLVGCNAAYRGDVIRAIGFPDQTLGEDILLVHRLRAGGHHIIYDPSIAVLHQNREGWPEFFRYNRMMGQAAADYHTTINLWWAAPALRFPLLAMAAPLAVLPSITRDLLRSRPTYLWRFVTLSPMCLLGNLVWANAFRQRARELRVQNERAAADASLSNREAPPRGSTQL